ncbi:50S ribosomal protein L5 [Candidatus Falkowbacteria bacterium HGW-Falkowbacteria-1]|jgi:large subunit ribosomal protein L5|uniref:Large ribosomal subunit protein uL5 n=1 Tax=Candidatus Falkowbacteria bacterium HGW-Falkowbacteria-1 TaxID=2013768 RepID=A0A2N2E9B7_9BACT|nr:MAG: 50S ribosomal protein L5 [Candidatus Falkowbacteria bacterium HGW-Falkowbacteria-1]
MTLKEKYQKEVIPKLKEKFKYSNNLLVPKVSKVVINVGFGRRVKDKDFIDNIEKTLIKISGQKPVFTKAKKSISSFKIREGMIIGAMVTLRGERMYHFLDKLINISFPRVRDFRGISEKSVDKQGNLTVGFKENTSFPEVKVDDINNIHGLEIIIDSNSKNTEEGLELFRFLGFPFKKEEIKK